MIAFVDTSALVKLYLIEPGSALMEAMAASMPLAVSLLAYPEAMASFARRQREGTLSAEEHREIVADLQVDWPSLMRIPLDEGILLRTAQLCQRHALRGADAVHLASAAALAAEGATVRFVTGDGRLHAAAKAEGLDALDPIATL